MIQKEYLEAIKKCIKEECVIFHYSWIDLNKKKKGGEFWDQTWHGKRKATHNTTNDIQNRINLKQNEILVSVDFDHPLRTSPVEVVNDTERKTSNEVA
jgi:hypothetical protein